MIENIGLNAPNVPLIDVAKTPQGSAGNANAERVGEEFEAFFYSMLLKEMRGTLEEGLFPGDESDSFGGMFDMQLGQYLAQSQPLGISDLIARSETL